MKAANCVKPNTESGCYVMDGAVVPSFEYDQIDIFIHNGMKNGKSEVRIYCKKYEMTQHLILASDDCCNISS
jgi:hypothetical protein